MKQFHLSAKVKAAANQNIKERDYWLQQLSGQWSNISFPPDYNTKTDPGEPIMHTVASRFPVNIYSQLMALTKENPNVLHIYMTAALSILLSKYTGSIDMILAVPIYKKRNSPGGDFINTVLPLRIQLQEDTSFKELLRSVKQTLVEAITNQNYPIAVLPGQLDIPVTANDFPLFGTALLVESIHDKADLDFFPFNMIFSFAVNGQSIETTIQYNSCLYEKSTVRRITSHLENLLTTALFNLDLTVSGLDILAQQEKAELLVTFNRTEAVYPHDRTIDSLFADQAAKTPEKIAVSAALDLDPVYLYLEQGQKNKDKKVGELDNRPPDKLRKCCFRKNSYLFVSSLHIPGKKEVFKIVKTHRHNSVIMNQNAFKLLDLFDAKKNLESLFLQIRLLQQQEQPGNQDIKFIIHNLSPVDVLEVDIGYNGIIEIAVDGKFATFTRLVKSLVAGHLIELAGFDSRETVFEDLPGDYFKTCDADNNEMTGDTNAMDQILRQDRKPSKAQVLFLGDTTGMPTTGLLYLASYLRRNGSKSIVRFYDPDRDTRSLEKNIRSLLEEIQPEIVAISMKWFLHIARVFEMCKIVKTFSPQIKVVLGGNTASYYPEQIIHNEWVDYLVCGDGEIPLLEICRGSSHIPNCLYKKDGTLVKNPITYLENEQNSAEIYLSHLEEILLSRHASLLGSFFIYTHKGCGLNCIFCGGSNNAHRKKFHREKMYRRGIEQVRNDILVAKKFTSTFFFDFDAPNKNLLDYCKQIWSGIDLSSHFCILSNLIPPSAELLEYTNKTFKYVYWNFDMASLSERHRLALFSGGHVKPQPRDAEMFGFLDECEKYNNAKVRINLIAGLPFFTDGDMKESERILNHLLNTYSCLEELHWARLHAQPGAPIVEDAGKYNMHSYAVTYDDFFTYSRNNFNENTQYPGFEYFNYPYIYYNQEQLNSQISRHYMDMNREIARYKEYWQRAPIFYEGSTYARLNEKAGQLAGLLREKGVQPGNIVALLVNPSIEMAVGILGILKAGAAYMPMDPHYPDHRLHYMLLDSRANILITTRELAEDNEIIQKIIQKWEGEKIYLGAEIENKTSCTANPRFPEHAPGTRLAYVIYTSGTTGRPRGVLIEHPGLVNYTLFRLKTYPFTAGETTLQSISYCFDAFGSNFYSALLSGGQVIMIPDSKKTDAVYTRRIIKDKRVTTMGLVPGTYDALLEGTHGSELESLRLVVMGGEKVGEHLIKTSKEKFPQVRLMSEYGPTEVTVTAAVNFDLDAVNPAIIGPPIANTRIFILDRQFQLLPIGVFGEIFIAGVGLARGYLNDPEKTFSKFCLRRPGALFKKTAPGPRKNFLLFNQKLLRGVKGGGFLEKSPPCKKIYKTGDIGRWLKNGSIEFLGRIDRQIKVSGYRIEPGEIEALLLTHREIKESVVIDRQNDRGETYLTAFIVGTSEKAMDTAKLREYMAGKLPGYMLPGNMVQIERIPLTTNGKIDRKALPALEDKKATQTYIAPRDMVEKKLAAIWADALKIDRDRIGIDANFFRLGGHSLKAIRLSTDIHNTFQVEMPMTELFKRLTIREQSEYIKSTKKFQLPPIENVEKKEYYEVSSAQKRLFILNKIEGENTTNYNVPTIMLIKAGLEKNRFEQAFQKMIRRHEPLRTSFHMKRDRPVQVIHQEIEFTVGCCLYSEAEAKERVEDFIKPFDLSKAPLLRVSLLDIGAHRHILLVDMHHIITDGISTEILIREFLALYRGESLADLKLQYKNFSEWQNKLAANEEIKKQETYWLELYKKKPLPLNMPTDFPRPSVRSTRGDIIYFTFPEELTARLKEFASGTGTTLYMILLAAFNILLQKYTLQEEIVIGTPVTGRNHPGLINVIGTFANMLAVKNYPAENKTFMDFLHEVKENVLNAFENQDYQFEELVGKLDIQVDPARNPLFDVVLNLYSVEPEAGETNPGTNETNALIMEPYAGVEWNVCKYDLLMRVRENAGTVTMSLEYSTALFKPESVRKMGHFFLDLTAQVLEHNESTLTLKELSIPYDFLLVQEPTAHEDVDFVF